MKQYIAAVLKQKCDRMHKILFQFLSFFRVTPRTPATGGYAPGHPGRGGREGREVKGRGGKGEGKAEVCVIAIGGIDAPEVFGDRITGSG